MLIRAIKDKLTIKVIQNMSKMMSSVHEPPPEKLPLTQKQLYGIIVTHINFYVKNISGYWEKIPAYPGETVLQALQRMQVKGIHYETCQGNDLVYRPHQRPHDPFSDGPKCNHCRIVLHNNWHQKVFAETDGMSTQQKQRLHGTLDNKSKSRLACCLPVQTFMNGMTFSIDPEAPESGIPQLF